jgi:hypothetical protein
VSEDGLPAVPDELYGRGRVAGLAILLTGGYLVFCGLLGPHGEGGGGMAYQLLTYLFGSFSVLVGLAAVAAGVPLAPRSRAKYAVRLHLALCVAVFAVLWFVPCWHWN